MTNQPTATGMLAERMRSWLDGLQGPPSIAGMESVLRLLAKWRTQVLANTYLQQCGPTVLQGPFEGMAYVANATEGALLPRLIGCYESGLHPHLLAFATEGLDCVIDIGCAEGYYAVGLARLLPDATVYAHDLSEAARASCRTLAAANGVADRVVVGGEFMPADFEAFGDRRILVIVDVEGAELDVLRPDLSPALASMRLIVETHDVYRPGALETLTARFAPTHDIVRVDAQPTPFRMPPFLQRLGHLDQLLATWEWREQPTPWLVMTPRPD